MAKIIDNYILLEEIGKGTFGVNICIFIKYRKFIKAET